VDHQTPWKYTDTTFKDAHIYVHFKAVYTLALEQCLGECDGGHIGRAHQLFHS
jgi:octaprenyl-diphosphate synthase